MSGTIERGLRTGGVMAEGSGLFDGIGDVCLPPDFDGVNYGTILIETRAAIARLRAGRETRDAAVREFKHDGTAWADAQYTDLCRAATYADATESVAEVALIAALVEGMFVRGARYLRSVRPPSLPPNASTRWSAPVRHLWDPRDIPDGRGGRWRRDAARGIVQFVEAMDVQPDPCFPASLRLLLVPLFTFRNQALHGGFEWSPAEVATFAEKVKGSGWDGHFEWTESGGKPWLAYMSHTFVDACLTMADESMRAFTQLPTRWGDGPASSSA